MFYIWVIATVIYTGDYKQFGGLTVMVETNVGLETCLANYLHNYRLLRELNSIPRTSKERMDFWYYEKKKLNISDRKVEE